MILHFEYGRLGNQLFQYCGFRKYYKEHRLLFVGCENFQQNFCVSRTKFISKKVFHPFLYRLLKKLILLLASVRVLSKLTEEMKQDMYIPIERKGLFSNILISHNIFFQHSSVINSIQAYPCLNSSAMQAAFEWIRSKEINQSSRQLIFLHVRRGDYINWPDSNFPAILDYAWYKRSMEYMIELKDNPTFIVMGDDYFYLRDIFGESSNCIISNNVAEVDMAIMSFCNSGILSASSFAWWGAFFSRSKYEQNSVFLAPRFWAGHRRGNWYPKDFITDWLTYID